MSVKAIVARMHDVCIRCATEIWPGDWCGYDGDDLVCGDCAELV